MSKEDALFGILSTSFAAFCVWLAVRIIGRRERWAIRTGVLAGILVLVWLILIGIAYLLDYYFGGV